MSSDKKMLLIERLKLVLSGLDHLENPKRNARIIELSLGLDGNGTHTLEEIQSVIDVEFPSETISRERIRVLRTSGIDNFKKALTKQWDSFYDALFDYVYKQSPIEVDLLAHRVADPNYKSFTLTHSDEKPFSERPFDVTGLLKIFECKPSKLNKKTLKLNRVYFDFSKSKGKQEGPTPRNSVECLLFLVPNSFGTKLDVLLSHTERAIKFNGMLQEQTLLPLMPKKLPVNKREELAHSLLVGHKDFLWLDEKKGYFTFTSSLDNRISRFAAKIFLCVDEIHVSLFASQISRAVRAQARVLKGESVESHFQERSNFLQMVSYGSDIPFSINDAIRYFVTTKLCTIDENNILRPTPLLKENVTANLRWSEQVLMDVLSTSPTQTLSQSEFKSKGMATMAKLASEHYIERLDEIIAGDEIHVSGNKYKISPAYVAKLQSLTRPAIDVHKSTMASSRKALQDLYLSLISGYKEKLKIVNANIAKTRDQIREAKAAKKTPTKTLLSLESQSSDLRLLKAECSDFSQRPMKLEEELVRLNRSIKKFEKAGNFDSKPCKAELRRVAYAETHLNTVQLLFSKSDETIEQQIISLAQKISVELMEYFAVNHGDESDKNIVASNMVKDQLDTILNFVPAIDLSEFSETEILKFADLVRYRVLVESISNIDTEIDRLPEPNDKYNDLILKCIKTLNVSTSGSCETDIDEFRSLILNESVKEETAHALGHFNQHVSYSPALVRVRKAEYSYVGSEASKQAELEFS
ncbi:hypothetical protein F7Q91_03500 [Vibrio chagasii]|uniref:Uncharacterized protein n=1 Tax=Vibrio chagasii TaxID=170679 RepID=A0A7V7NX14_9VIBR|nr:hypothetical protein [Vibrio chagasii]KAB0482488.1 hypothetical protein F7Q91_03500 [Vibrio chagasii]